MAAQPHPVTESGQTITITNGFPAPLKACTVTLSYTQAGNGDASPSNVRDITGLTGLSVYVSPTSSGGTEYPYSWSGTIYGGTLDVLNGTLLKSWDSFRGSDVSDIKVDRYDATTVIGKLTVENLTAAASNDVISNRFSVNIGSGNPGRMVVYKNLHMLYIVMPRSDFAGTPTAADIQQWLIDHPTVFVYPLADPVAYQLTPHQIRTFRGENHIRCNAGILSAAYYTI